MVCNPEVLKPLHWFISRKCFGESWIETPFNRLLTNLFFSRSSPRQSPKERRVSRSGSVPNLTACHRSSIGQQNPMSPTHRTHTHHRSSTAKGKIPRHRASTSGRTHLHALLANRQGASFDETGPYFHKSSIDGGSEHCSKRDRNKRSDTAKRHVLARQKQVDNFEQQTKFNKSRR